ncbi:MAG: zinc metallopeptidase [Paludibacteraceae bacterium]|nr:zinc metallopeptidase [Paludibacteraceae bacterium]MBP5136580.1 zinc metallopeptidase [Paludibacteraceae bacterium]
MLYTGSGWVIFIGFALISWIISHRLKSKFEKYSKVMMPLGMTGKDIAEKMLRENRINDVKVQPTGGSLTDFYNPANQTVNLSETVFASHSIAAAAVAAHECGHAIQHADAYGPLKLRTKLVPAVSVASRWMQWLILGGLLIANQLGTTLLLAGIILYSVTTLFAFVTLPVEIDASRRAVLWLEGAGIVDDRTKPMVTDALRAAAYTYVVAALGSLGTLLYYIMIFMGRRD